MTTIHRGGSEHTSRTGGLPAVGVLVVLLVSAACSAPGAAARLQDPARTPAAGTWSARLAPAGDDLTAVSCATAARCWSVGQDAEAPAGAGAGGTGAPGTVIVASDDGGRTWSSEVAPPDVGFLGAVWCADALHCAAAGQLQAGASSGGGVILTSDDGGATWTADTLPPATDDVTALTCADPDHCLAVGRSATGLEVLASDDGGSSWTTRASLPPGMVQATGLACATRSLCWITTATPAGTDLVHGAVLGTTDGGATWHQQTLPGDSGTADDVACADPSWCVAVGSTSGTLLGTAGGQGTLFVTSDGGADWQPQSLPPSVGALVRVTCLPPAGQRSVPTCLAMGKVAAAETALTVLREDGPGGTVTESGTAPRPGAGVAHAPPALSVRTSLVEVPADLAGASCPDAGACVVVGDGVTGHLTP